MPAEFNPDDITAWISALEADTGPDYATTQAFARKSFHNIVDPDWHKLLEHGLLDIVLDILSGDDVGGRRWEVSNSAQSDYLEEILIPYMIDLLIIFANALVYLAERAGSVSGSRQETVGLRYCNAEPSFVKSALEVVMTKYSAFIRLLLRENSPWIPMCLYMISLRMYPETMGGCEENVVDEQWTFANVLSRCHETLDTISITFHMDADVGDPLLACVCESAKLMFQLWMHSEEWAASDAALFGFTDTLSHSSRLYGRDPYTPFFQQIKDDRTITMITKHACEAMHSDLRRHHHPFMFDRLITCLVLFRQQNWIPEQSRTERSILWSSMVAFRERVCTEGIFEDDQWPDDNPVVVEMGYFVSTVICSAVDERKPRPSLPERWVHETIVVLSRAMCATFKDESNNNGINQYVKALMELAGMLHYYSRHPSSRQSLHRSARTPPSLAVRNYTFTRWKTTQRAMRAKCFHLHAEKRRLWTAWNAIGAKLEPGADLGPREFGPLQRCAN